MDKMKIDEIVSDDSRFIVRAVRNSINLPIDDTIVDDYAENIEALPPVEVWLDTATNKIFLLDGQHRLAAHKKMGYEEIAYQLFHGTEQDAMARANTANFTNGFQLSRTEKKEAKVKVLTVLYELSNNWLAKDYLHCSPTVVANLRDELEKLGTIPLLDTFKRKGGGVVARNKPEEVEEEVDETPELISDEEFFSGMSENLDDGGYDVEEDEANEEMGLAELGSSRKKKGGQNVPDDLLEKNRETEVIGDFNEFDATSEVIGIQKNLKFTLAPHSSPLAADVVFYVDDKQFNIPVTILIVENEVTGLPKVADEHGNALVLQIALAKEMKLL